MTDLESLQTQLEQVREELGQKESKVIKLKGLLTRSMRSDKRREQEIEALHVDIADKDRRIKSLDEEVVEQKALTNELKEKISKLEIELEEMNNRLQTGVGSEAAQKKTERMRQMLEKSNSLYSELELKYQKALTEIEEMKRSMSKPKCQARILRVKDKEFITLNDDGTYSVDSELQGSQPISVEDYRRSPKAEKSIVYTDPDVAQYKTYLRTILLEFFIGDSKTQNRLVPVILQLLDCSKEQIEAAQRGYADSNQIISKAVSALGL